MAEGDRRESEGGAPEESADTTEVEARSGVPLSHEELAARIGIKDNRVRELYEEITTARLAADEAVATREAGEAHIEALDRDRGRLRERISELEEEARGRRRRREGFERRISRLERELERKDGEIARRDLLLQSRAEALEEADRKAGEEASRGEVALQAALGRVEMLERDLEGREAEISGLRDVAERLRDELEDERSLREQLAEPANRLRAGIDLFNGSEGRGSVDALSRTLGRPEVHVALGRGKQPPVLLSFTWQGVTWQAHAVEPGPAVEEPRVYLQSSGEDLSGVDHEPPNAHVGPGGRVALGL